MFCYKTSFSKKAVFSEKTAKNPFVGGYDPVLRGGEHLVTKTNITFFVDIDVLNIFHLTTFSKKAMFSKIKAKNYFLGPSPLLRERGRAGWTTKINIIFFGENGVTNTVFKFFSQKTPVWLKRKKLVLGAHFPPYLWFYWSDCVQKQ